MELVKKYLVHGIPLEFTISKFRVPPIHPKNNQIQQSTCTSQSSGGFQLFLTAVPICLLQSNPKPTHLQLRNPIYHQNAP